MKTKFQLLGKAMLVPLAAITIAGFLMGLGGALTDPATMEVIGLDVLFYEGSVFWNMALIMKGMGDAVFKNLPILYATGIAFSLSKKEQGWAALSAVLFFLTMHATISIMFGINGITPDTTSQEFFMEAGMTDIDAVKWNSLYGTELGYFTYKMGIFGGLIAGLTTMWLQNRYYNKKLPTAFSFFAGTRSVSILAVIVGAGFGVALYWIWPFIGLGIASFAKLIEVSGVFGTFIWGSMDKALLPLGLHHLITTPMRWTELGGTTEVCGEMISGTTAIYYAELACTETVKLTPRLFSSGRAIIHLGSLPGAALAMYHTTPKHNRKKVAGLLIPAVVTMIGFGITEPLEFTFLFVSPLLYFLFHVPMTGLSFALAELSNISFYGSSLKDWIPLALQFRKLYILPYIFLIPSFFTAYYFMFKWAILKFNISTPGRHDSEDEEIKLFSKDDYNNKKDDARVDDGRVLARNIIKALGESENIVEVDNCVSRLRILVKEDDKVLSDGVFKNQLGASGVVRLKGGVQVIYGPKVIEIAQDMRDELDRLRKGESK